MLETIMAMAQGSTVLSKGTLILYRYKLSKPGTLGVLRKVFLLIKRAAN